MKALYNHGFPVPRPYDVNRHCVVMALGDGYQLNSIQVAPVSTVSPPLSAARPPAHQHHHESRSPTAVMATVIVTPRLFSSSILPPPDVFTLALLPRSRPLGRYPNTQAPNRQELKHPGVVFDALMEQIVRLASFGLIHCDFNEFNLLVSDDEEVTIIDFPQMISTDHINAEYYFNRDVECVRTFFRRCAFRSAKPGAVV